MSCHAGLAVSSRRAGDAQCSGLVLAAHLVAATAAQKFAPVTPGACSLERFAQAGQARLVDLGSVPTKKCWRFGKSALPKPALP